MRLRFPASSASQTVWLAAVTRTFCGLVVDEEELHAGAWLSALLGSLLAVPVSAALSSAIRSASRRPSTARLLPILLAAALLADGACAFSLLTGSAVFLGVEGAPPFLHRLLAAVILLWVVTRNGDAVGYGAMLWLKLLPLLALPVILLQLPHYRVDWLFPVLGGGMAKLLSAAIRAAGWIALYDAAASLLSNGSPADKPRRKLSRLLSAGALAAALIVLRSMMTPALPGAAGRAWLNRLDALLTNCRAPVYTQLPMIALWLISLLNLAAFDVFAASATLQRLFPGSDGRLCAFATVAALFIAQIRPDPAFRAAWAWLPVAFALAILPLSSVMEVMARE